MNAPKQILAQFLAFFLIHLAKYEKPEMHGSKITLT